MSRESDTPGKKHVKSNLSESGAKRPRMDNFMVLDSMDEEDVAGDVNVRNWSGKNGPARSDSSAREEEGEEDDNESYKDALMGEPPAHAEGCISPSLGHHTPETEPTLPGPLLVERSPSVHVTGVTILPPDLQTEFAKVKEEIIIVSPPPSPKANGLPHTEVSTVSVQNHRPSPSSVGRRSYESPIRSRSGATHGSSASKHSDYSISESSDDNIVTKGNNPDSHRSRRSKSKSSVVSETASSEADDESSQLQAARKLQKEKEEQERENLIREAEKDKLESDVQAIEAEAQAKREQHEASEREEQYRIERERLEKEKLGIKRTKPEATASAKSTAEKAPPVKTAQAEPPQQQDSQKKPPPGKPTMKTDSDRIIYEGMLARRKERSARLKAERDAKATQLREEKEREKLALEEAERNKELALAQQDQEGNISQEEPELPDAASSEDNQKVSTAEKTDRKVGRTAPKPEKTVAELKTEMEAKEKEKELQKEHQKAEREEKRRAQQEEKERKPREKKEALEKGKQKPKNQEPKKAPETKKRVAEEKGLRGKEPRSSSNESENILPPVRNSALKRTDPSNPTTKRPTHVSFADQNPSSSVPAVSSPTPWVIKRTPILPPGYIPKAPASQQLETSTAPDRAKLPSGATTSMPPPTTDGVVQAPLKPKAVGGKQSNAATVVKSPRTRVTPVEKPGPKKLVQPSAQPESHSESGSETEVDIDSELETEVDTDSESDSESIDSAREATLATPTPSGKTTKAPPPIIQNIEATKTPSVTPKKKPAPSPSVSTAKPTASKVKAKTAVTRYEESTESSSSDENQVPSTSPLLPTSAQRPKPAQSDSGSDTDVATESESEDENPALPVTGTPAMKMPTTTRPTASSQQSITNGSQRYKSLTDMELDPIPDVRDVHQAPMMAAIMASGKKRLNGSNSSQARKKLELDASDDSEGSSDDSSDDSEEEKRPKAKTDALAGKRASIPRKSGFRFRV